MHNVCIALSQKRISSSLHIFLGVVGNMTCFNINVIEINIICDVADIKLRIGIANFKDWDLYSIIYGYYIGDFWCE